MQNKTKNKILDPQVVYFIYLIHSSRKEAKKTLVMAKPYSTVTSRDVWNRFIISFRFLFGFYRMMLYTARIMLSKDVCPSSHAGILSKWLNVSSNFFNITITAVVPYQPV